MKFGSQSQTLVLSSKAQVAAITIVSLLLWLSGLPTWLPSARAASLTDVSDTLSDSDLSAGSVHRLQFTTISALDADDTIQVTLDPAASLFTVNNLGASDFFATTSVRVVAACGAFGNEVTVSTTTEIVTLTVCAGDSIPAGVIAFNMGTTTATKITNPVSAGSRVIRIQTRNEGGSLTADIIDQADTRVYIIDDVVVTASVDSSFTFTITGVANGSSVNGSATTTSTTTTSTLIPFETLAPGVAKVLAQDLSVLTNAANGFSVTVYEDQNLTSSTGADIDLYINGATTSTPTAWTTPSNTLNQENTYGHFGITSEDNSLSTGDPFGTALWVGDFTADSPREVFYHSGPADGTTDHEGDTRVGFAIEIENLQEAGTDYTNTLTYIATPTF